ncbi:MAG: hypothetical protein K2Z25_24995 [Beijerinckiaceae bacterium]|nr:hypothetical protein [Beijerinckiaceae bacterium]
MLIFLMSAVLSGAVFQLALISEYSPETAGSRRWTRPGLVDVTIEPRFVAGAKVALRTVVFFVVCFVLYHLVQLVSRGGALTALAQDQIVALAMGLVFGPVFVSWISAVAREQSGQPIGWGKVAVGCFLGLFFVVGMFGQDAGKLIRRYAESIKGVKFGSVEVSFGDGRVTARPSGDLVLLAPATNAGQPPGASVGLALLSQLDELIVRDCVYVKEIRAEPTLNCPTIQTSTGETKTVEGEAGRDVFAIIKQTERVLLRCNEKPSRSDCLSAEITATHLLARHLVVGFAACLSSLNQNGTESTFINSRLAQLAARYREMLHLLPNDRHFPLRAAHTFRDESQALISHLHQTYPRTVKVQDVHEKCSPLVTLFCPEPPTSPLDKACAFDARTGFFEVPDNQRSKDVVQVLVKMFTEQDFQARPYAVAATAQTLAYLRDYETALYFLFRWLQTHGVKADDVAGRLARGGLMERDRIVYTIRARITIFVIMEEWMKVLQASTSDALREQHILNLEQLITIQTLAPHLGEIVHHRSARRLGPVQASSSRVLVADRLCRWQDARLMRLFMNFQLHKLNFAYHALRHPDYRSKYAASAQQLMAETVDADLGCIESTIDRITIRADAMDLYARILLRRAQDASQKVGALATLDELEQALDLAQRGRALVADLKSLEDAARSVAENFLDKISLTKAVDTDASLGSTISEIEAAIKQAKSGE